MLGKSEEEEEERAVARNSKVLGGCPSVSSGADHLLGCVRLSLWG